MVPTVYKELVSLIHEQIEPIFVTLYSTNDGLVIQLLVACQVVHSQEADVPVLCLG